MVVSTTKNDSKVLRVVESMLHFLLSDVLRISALLRLIACSEMTLKELLRTTPAQRNQLSLTAQSGPGKLETRDDPAPREVL